MFGDPELEERQRRWNEFRTWHLETLHRAIPFRIVCQLESGIETHLSKLKFSRSRLRSCHTIATMLRGECAVCQEFILYPPAVMPREPLRICVPCAKANVSAGDLLWWDDQRPTRKARKRRPRRPDGR